MRRLGLDVAWAAALAAVATLLVVHAGGVWDVVTSGDLHAMLLPKYEYAARRLVGGGGLASWNPWELCGVPILGTAQGQVLHPVVLLAFALWSPWTALQAVFAVHVFVLALGLGAYLRRHDVGRTGAVVATAVALAGVLTTPDFVGIDHPSFLAAVAWVPVLLLFAERGSVPGIAVASAAQWLAGYPELPMTTALLAAAIITLAGPAPRAGRLVRLGLGLVLGVALAAVQVLPLLEAIGEGTREALEWQFALWRRRSGLHAPWDVVTQLSARQGWAVLVLAAVAVVLARPRAPRLAWLTALVWCVVALNPPFDVLYVAPGFRGVRFGYAWSAIAGTLLGLLVADGTARLERAGGAWPWAGRALALVVVLGALRVLEAAPALDFPNVGLRFPAPDQALVASRLPVLREGLATAPGTRVVAERELVAGAGLRHALPMPFGHEPAMPPRRVMHLLEEAGLVNLLGIDRRERWVGAAARPDILALLGVRFVVVPRGAEATFLATGFTRRATLPGDDVLLERPSPSRVRFVHRVAVAAAPTEEATLAALFEHAGEAAELAVVDRLPAHAPSPRPAPDGAREHVTIVDDEPERVTVVVTAASPGLLVLADTHYPGWIADVDGTPVEIVRADHAFRGVALDAGTHRVTFRYAPASVRVGAQISAAALLAVLILWWHRRRRARDVHPGAR